MTTTFRGVYPVFQTPFLEDYSVDFEALCSEIQWIANQGVHGVVFGMVSEILRLSDRERKAVIEVACGAAKDRGLPCIASVGAESTYSALHRMDDALEGGATGLMITPPLLGAHSEQELTQHFRVLIEHCDVPVVIQDASAYVGQELSVSSQVLLYSEFGDRAMFKPEAVPVAPAVIGLRQATNSKATVFEGMGGAALIDTFPAGVSGSMPGAEVCWAIVALWQALETENVARAHSIHKVLGEMIAEQTTLDSFVVCEKFLLAEQNVLARQHVRAPVTFTLEDSTRHKLRSLLVQLQEVVDQERPNAAEGSVQHNRTVK